MFSSYPIFSYFPFFTGFVGSYFLSLFPYSKLVLPVWTTKPNLSLFMSFFTLESSEREFFIFNMSPWLVFYTFERNRKLKEWFLHFFFFFLHLKGVLRWAIISSGCQIWCPIPGFSSANRWVNPKTRTPPTQILNTWRKKKNRKENSQLQLQQQLHYQKLMMSG